MQPLDFFLARGGLRGTRAGRKTRDEFVELRDLFLALRVFGFDAGANRHLRKHHVVVAAVVHDDGLVVDVGDVRADTVQKMAVVRNHDQDTLVFEEIILKPVNGIEIEVVRGLVEQQDLGIAEQSLRQQDANLLAALEFTHGALVQWFVDTEAIEKNCSVGFGSVSVLFADDSFEFAETHAVLVGEFVVRFGVEGFAFLQRFPKPRVAHDDGVDHAIFVKRELVLAQNAEFFRPRDVTFGRFELAREDFHERGLAGAIRAGNGVAASGEKSTGNVLEQYSSAEPHSDVVNGEQRRLIIPRNQNLCSRGEPDNLFWNGPDFVVIRAAANFTGMREELDLRVRCARRGG